MKTNISKDTSRSDRPKDNCSDELFTAESFGKEYIVKVSGVIGFKDISKVPVNNRTGKAGTPERESSNENCTRGTNSPVTTGNESLNYFARGRVASGIILSVLPWGERQKKETRSETNSKSSRGALKNELRCSYDVWNSCRADTFVDKKPNVHTTQLGIKSKETRILATNSVCEISEENTYKLAKNYIESKKVNQNGEGHERSIQEDGILVSLPRHNDIPEVEKNQQNDSKFTQNSQIRLPVHKLLETQKRTVAQKKNIDVERLPPLVRRSEFLQNRSKVNGVLVKQSTANSRTFLIKHRKKVYQAEGTHSSTNQTTENESQESYSQPNESLGITSHQVHDSLACVKNHPAIVSSENHSSPIQTSAIESVAHERIPNPLNARVSQLNDSLESGSAQGAARRPRRWRRRTTQGSGLGSERRQGAVGMKGRGCWRHAWRVGCGSQAGAVIGLLLALSQALPSLLTALEQAGALWALRAQAGLPRVPSPPPRLLGPTASDAAGLRAANWAFAVARAIELPLLLIALTGALTGRARLSRGWLGWAPVALLAGAAQALLTLLQLLALVAAERLPLQGLLTARMALYAAANILCSLASVLLVEAFRRGQRWPASAWAGAAGAAGAHFEATRSFELPPLHAPARLHRESLA